MLRSNKTSSLKQCDCNKGIYYVKRYPTQGRPKMPLTLDTVSQFPVFYKRVKRLDDDAYVIITRVKVHLC